MTRPRSKRRSGGTLVYALSLVPSEDGTRTGFVHDWLALGPLDQPLGDNAQPDVPNIDPLNITELDRVQMGKGEAVWEAVHCQADHWLAWHGFAPTPASRQAWSFVHLHSAQPQTVTLTLTTNGTPRLWLNGEGVHATQSDTQNHLTTYTVAATLKGGANPLLLHLRTVGVRDMSIMAALQVAQSDTQHEPLHVHLPTRTRTPRRRQRLEAIYAQTHLDRAVYTKADPVRLHYTGRDKKVPVMLRLQKPSGAIYAETIGALNPNATVESIRGSQLPNGSLDAVVMAPFQQFYTEKLRARQTFPVYIANHAFYPAPSHHSVDERLIEALQAQAQVTGSVYAELAKMAFGLWEQVDSEAVEHALQRVLDGDATSLPDLLGLITLRARMPVYRGFPTSLLPMLDHGLAAYASGNSRAAWDANDEANQLAAMAARHLLAQLYPQAQAAAPQAHALVEWMAQRGRSGFDHWHADHDLLVTALAPLLSLAQDEAVREVAASLLDLIAFSLALHSFGGTFGPSRSRATASTLRSGRFAPEAALTRLWWGAGGYAPGVENNGLAAATAVALAGKSYQLPDAIRTIALAQPDSDALWIQERHAQAHVVSYRTPDYLLSSVQSYRTGERGHREQVWQATLGAEAIVFGNHPAAYSQADSAAPGWWVGNGVLPRVAQHQDALIALYSLPKHGWPHNALNFTHAYFPTYAFDEFTFAEGWAFARVGSGYLALGSLPGFHLVEQGADGGRELRVEGSESAWFCQMGRQATDGAFADFQRKVLVRAPQRHEQRFVTWTTLRGDTLTLGMDGPLLVNGQARSLLDFPRHHSPFAHAPFPAEDFEIAAGADVLRLHF